MRKIQLRLHSNCNNKLSLVKYLKEICGLPLRDAKELCDSLHNIPYQLHNLDVHDSVSIKEVIETLEDIPWGDTDSGNKFTINGSSAWNRELKLLSIGIGDKEEYVGFLKNLIIEKVANSDYILDTLLSKLEIVQLKDILNKIEF